MNSKTPATGGRCLCCILQSSIVFIPTHIKHLCAVDTRRDTFFPLHFHKLPKSDSLRTARSIALRAERKKAKEEEATRGVAWGMDTEDEPSATPGAAVQGGDSSFYLEDPKKALRTYFDREAASLDYEVEETGPGHARVYTCQVCGGGLVVLLSHRGPLACVLSCAPLLTRTVGMLRCRSDCPWSRTTVSP